MEKKLELIAALEKRPPLLLHLCCAPCSAYVIEMLHKYFHLRLFFYDPNIHPYEEYVKRRDEAKGYADSLDISFLEGAYDAGRWFDVMRGLENEPEKGSGCSLCYDVRLTEAAMQAKETGCDYFTTVLSISPHKDAARINEIGYRLADKYSLNYLPADFKKREGFKKSIEISKKEGFYRQNYCGCIYSARKVTSNG